MKRCLNKRYRLSDILRRPPFTILSPTPFRTSRTLKSFGIFGVLGGVLSASCLFPNSSLACQQTDLTIFQCLGISEKDLDLDLATLKDRVNTGYKKKALQIHPDRFADAPEEARKAATASFQKLSNLHDRFVENPRAVITTEQARLAVLATTQAHSKLTADQDIGTKAPCPPGTKKGSTSVAATQDLEIPKSLSPKWLEGCPRPEGQNLTEGYWAWVAFNQKYSHENTVFKGMEWTAQCDGKGKLSALISPILRNPGTIQTILDDLKKKNIIAQKTSRGLGSIIIIDRKARGAELIFPKSYY